MLPFVHCLKTDPSVKQLEEQNDGEEQKRTNKCEEQLELDVSSQVPKVEEVTANQRSDARSDVTSYSIAPYYER